MVVQVHVLFASSDLVAVAVVVAGGHVEASKKGCGGARCHLKRISLSWVSFVF